MTASIGGVIPNLPGPTAAAGYVASLLAGDHEMRAAYENAFTAEALLMVLAQPIRNLGSTLADAFGQTPAEVGDALIIASLPHRLTA